MRDEIQYVRSEWEKTAKNWQGSCEENDRLNKQIQALVSEKDNLNAIKDRLELDNKNLIWTLIKIALYLHRCKIVSRTKHQRNLLLTCNPLKPNKQ